MEVQEEPYPGVGNTESLKQALRKAYCSVPWVRAVLLLGIVEELEETSRDRFA